MRLAQQLIGYTPMIPNSGNHELEPNLHGNYFTVRASACHPRPHLLPTGTSPNASPNVEPALLQCFMTGPLIPSWLRLEVLSHMPVGHLSK